MMDIRHLHEDYSFLGGSGTVKRLKQVRLTQQMNVTQVGKRTVRKAAFVCFKAAEKGGEFLVVDGRRMLRYLLCILNIHSIFYLHILNRAKLFLSVAYLALFQGS
jgi:hypothetical protein